MSVLARLAAVTLVVGCSASETPHQPLPGSPLHLLFAREFDDAQDPTVIATADSGAQVSYTNLAGATVLVRLEPDGRERNRVTLPSMEVAVAVDAADRTLLYGQIRNTTTLGSITLVPTASISAVAALIDPTGAPIWAKVIASGGRTVGGAVNDDGAVVVGGSSDGANVDFGAGKQTGTPGWNSGFIAVLDRTGSPRWSHVFDGERNTRVDRVSIAADGHVAALVWCRPTCALGGPTLDWTGEVELVLVSYDPEGRFLWQRAFTGKAYSDWQLVHTAKGELIVSAEIGSSWSLDGTPTFESGGLVATFGPAGDLIWQKRLLGVNYVTRPSLSPDGTVTVSGVVERSADFDGATLDALGGAMYLASVRNAAFTRVSALGVGSGIGAVTASRAVDGGYWVSGVSNSPTHVSLADGGIDLSRRSGFVAKLAPDGGS